MKGYKILAKERMQILFKSALANAKNNPHIAQQNANTLRRISSRYRLNIPYNMQQAFCKKCKMFIAPGMKSKIRTSKTATCTTCGYCGHVYRKINRA